MTQRNEKQQNVAFNAASLAREAGSMDELREVQPSKRSAGRPTAQDTAFLEQRVLDAAEQEFLTFGFAGGSIERIALAAGITRSGLYRRFGGRSGLFTRVVDRQINALRRLAENIARSSPNPMTQLHDSLLEYCRFLASPKTVDLQRILIANTVIPRPDMPEALSLPVELSAPIDQMIADAQRQGELREGDPALLRDIALRLLADGVRWKALIARRTLSSAEIDADFARFWPSFLGLANRQPGRHDAE